MEVGTSCSLLCHLTSLLLLLQLPMGSSEKFQVQCPLHPIVAVLGGDATLTCSLYPVMNAENMELRWFRSQISEAVFVYQHQQEQKEEQLPQYTGRTSLVKDMLSYGEATIHINEVQVSDDGLYTCFFKHGGFYEESTLELRVAGVGSVPEVHIQGPEEDGVRVVCTTSAWFPKPQVQWRNLNGEKLLGFSEIHAQDTEGLFHVETSLVVRSSTAGNVTCSILNHILGQEKSMAIFIPEPFFPQASPWIPAFLVSTTMLGLLILGVGYFIRKERSATLQLRKEQLTLQQLKEEDRQRKEKALEIRDEFQAELNRRKKIYQAAWRKAQLYADWRKEQFQAWPVTLDPHSADPNFMLSQENKNVTCNSFRKNNFLARYSVKGLESITSRQCYWEVEVTGSRWAVGVCSEGNYEKNWLIKCPRNGFWVVGYSLEGYFAYTVPKTWLTLRQVPSRVGVFLDYDDRSISFYNMADGSHIFSFHKVLFSDTLFPYFMLKSVDGSLTICSTVGGPRELPLPLRMSTLNESLSPLEKGLSSGSGGDDTLPGPESPLVLHCSKSDPHRYQSPSFSTY